MKHCISQKKLSKKIRNYNNDDYNNHNILKNYFRILSLKLPDNFEKEKIGYDENTIFNFLKSNRCYDPFSLDI